jgi:hypothetical protein
MKLHLAVFTAAALIGAAPAFAQSSTGSMGTGGTSVAPGAAANGTTPGALGNGTNQSLQPSTGGTGLGYNPTTPSLGVTPNAQASPTYNPSGATPPATGPSVGSPGSTGSSASGAATGGTGNSGS